MAVALDSTGTAFLHAGVAVTTLSMTTLTVGSGSNTVLLACLFTTGNPGPITVTTWDGVTMTATLNNQTGPRLFMYQLLAPNAGNKTLTFTWTNSDQASIGAAEFSGVDQTTPIVTGDNQSQNGTSVTASATVPSATGDATVAFVDTARALSADSQTTIWIDNVGFVGTAASYALGGASNTHSWTLDISNAWTELGVHLKSVSVAGGVVFGDEGGLMTQVIYR